MPLGCLAGKFLLILDMSIFFHNNGQSELWCIWAIVIEPKTLQTIQNSSTNLERKAVATVEFFLFGVNAPGYYHLSAAQTVGLNIIL